MIMCQVDSIFVQNTLSFDCYKIYNMSKESRDKNICETSAIKNVVDQRKLHLGFGLLGEFIICIENLIIVVRV